MPFTHHYLEYRTVLLRELCHGACDNETTYGLNISEIEGGIFIRISRDNMFWYQPNGEPGGYSFSKTALLGMHPNTRVCKNEWCSSEFYWSNLFVFLLENETYYDEFNNMEITFLEANESGALVRIHSFAPPEPIPPKSLLNNTGALNINGYLLMKVQKQINNEWQDYQIIVNENIPRIIQPNSYLALDLIWNEIGFTPTQEGDYRVYASF